MCRNDPLKICCDVADYCFLLNLLNDDGSRGRCKRKPERGPGQTRPVNLPRVPTSLLMGAQECPPTPHTPHGRECGLKMCWEPVRHLAASTVVPGLDSLPRHTAVRSLPSRHTSYWEDGIHSPEDWHSHSKGTSFRTSARPALAILPPRIAAPPLTKPSIFVIGTQQLLMILPHQRVQKTIRFQETGSVKDRPRPGRPKSATNEALCLDILQYDVEDLSSYPSRNCNEVWFQQDGAPPHYGLHVREYLNNVFFFKSLDRQKRKYRVATKIGISIST
ncbi:hypothetical protein J6590_039865 [Homalodisca vitripennis]|nr:hypothetical protein J6590_039865 [Homalodisca vitripennis]